MNLDAYACFTIYSLPGQTNFTFGAQRDGGLDGQENERSFVIRPFEQTAPVERIRLDLEQAIDASEISFTLPQFNREIILSDQGNYQSSVVKAIELTRRTRGKVVLSQVWPHEVSLNLGDTLMEFRQRYPNAFIYLLKHPKHGVWMGGSPEVLLEVAHGLARTMALAGTRWGDDLFEQKEFDEQMLVTKDLLERLEDQAVEVSDVYEQAYGNIRHLRTDLRWEAEGSALSYAERLHPSPAVGGYPRTVALDFISNEEGYSRSLYTGYLGLDDPMSASSLFVNLRCMQLFRGLVLTYAGGGINADSRPEIEWEEIHRKVETLISAWKYA